VLLELLYTGQGPVQGNAATLTVSNFPPANNAKTTWHLALPLSQQG